MEKKYGLYLVLKLETALCWKKKVEGIRFKIFITVVGKAMDLTFQCAIDFALQENDVRPIYHDLGIQK